MMAIMAMTMSMTMKIMVIGITNDDDDCFQKNKHQSPVRYLRKTCTKYEGESQVKHY